MEPAYQEKTADLEVCDGFEVGLQFELGKNDGLITAVCAGMANDHQSIDVALGKKSQGDLFARGSRSRVCAVAVFVCLDLESVGNDVTVRDHDSFLNILSVSLPAKHRIVLTGRPDVPLE